jgi:hypothetical protein
MSGGRKLPHTREKAIAALLECDTVEAAAARARVGQRTLQLWLRDGAEFRQQYRAARARLLDGALLRLQRGAQAAAETLVKRVRTRDAGPAIRAACAVLDQVTRLGGLLDLEARLAEVERRLDEEKR